MRHNKMIPYGATVLFLAFNWSQTALAQTKLFAHDERPIVQIEALMVPGETAKLFDKYQDIPFDDEKARLDNFAIELQNEPRWKGYIIVFGKVGKPKYLAKKRADRAKQYLLYSRNIDPGRIVSLDHCVRKALEFELWIVPNGATPPVPCRGSTKPAD